VREDDGVRVETILQGYVHNVNWMLQIWSQITIHSYLEASELVGVKVVLVSKKGYSYIMR
jgi:hypothetical protein